jgi:hypothetical protein
MSVATEVRLNPDGTLDEVVAWGFAHLEQMSDSEWVLLIDTVDGQLLRVPIYSKRAKVSAFAERDGTSTLAVPMARAAESAAARDVRRINRNRKKIGMEPLA